MACAEGCSTNLANDPVPQHALTYATSTIDSVTKLAHDAYQTARGLLGSITNLIDIGSISTSVTLSSPGTLPDVSQYLSDLPEPPDLGDIPETPPIVYDFNESLYTSQLGDALNVALLNEIQNGSTGLTTVVENDIYNRESERDLQELDDGKMRVAAEWAEFNCPLPDETLMANLRRLDIEYQNKYSDKSRDVRIESFKRADDNAKFVKELASKYEDIIRRYMGDYWERQLKKASDIMNYGVLVYDALIKWKMALVELFKGEAQAYEAQAHAIAAIAGVEIASYEAVTKYIVAQADIAMKGIDAQVEILKGKVQAVIAASDGIARVASTLAAGSMSAIHAGVTVGFDGRESTSSSESVNASCDQNYNHTCEEE